jgi:cation diffusion facilitator CzcD-associated flavoprotein CzcO
MEMNATKRVCVIGAGVSGLVTANILKADGFDVVVFDQASSIGGVWTAVRTYPELRTNTTREQYAFSDFPYPETVDDFPTAEQVRSYLEAYVDHFDLRDLLRLSTEVVSIAHAAANTQQSHPGFRVVVRPTGESGESAEPETLHFDVVAVCNGVFSEPYVPHIEGIERFTGQVLHSSQLTDAALVAGKRVIVVGAGKSALDCATLAVQHAQACTLVFRSPRWMVPRYFFGIRYDWLFFTRFFESHYRYHRLGPIEAFVHGRLNPLIQLSWRMQSRLVQRVLLNTPPVLVPDKPLPGEKVDIGVGSDFYDAVRNGRAAPKRAEINAFTDATTIELTTGEQITADVVVFATGWRQNLDFLDADLRRRVQPNGNFHLYRHILPPGDLRLGFVGYAQTFMNTLTSEIAAHWLSQHFRGELTLPDAAAMEREIAHVQQWAEEVFHPARRGYFLGPHIAHYVDDLMRDMGLPTHRASNPITEYLGRFLPRRYQDVGAERRQARSTSGHEPT